MPGRIERAGDAEGNWCGCRMRCRKICKVRETNNETRQRVSVQSCGVLTIAGQSVRQSKFSRRKQAGVVEEAAQGCPQSTYFLRGLIVAGCTNRFLSPCQHSKYSCCKMRVCIAKAVG